MAVPIAPARAMTDDSGTPSRTEKQAFTYLDEELHRVGRRS